MIRRVRVDKVGGPEVLRFEEVELPGPGPGEALVRHTAIGLNFIDTYHRSGLYELPLPATLGMEAAGRVEAVGPGVTAVAAGDRVAYASPPVGAYAEARVMPADRLVKLPDHVSDRAAAAVMLKGMTAEYLLRRTYAVRQGDTILFHAAAGGVGLIACQWARHLGAEVIGTAGSDEKAAIARAHGCAHVIVYTRENFVARVKEITGGKGVPVVYDSVGKSTWDGSLDCLRPRGLMVSFGNASGAVPPIQPVVLSQKGSLYLTRPTLMAYTAARHDLEESARALFDVMRAGAVKVEVRRTYALKDVAQAHRDLETRKTVGSSVLLP